MWYMHLLMYLLVLITASTTMSTTAGSHGGKIHFQDSSELEELDIDKRPGPHRDNRNHRGRALDHHNEDNVPKFEQGIPDVYPIRGPPQAPLVLPDKAVGIQNHKAKESTPSQPVQLPVGHHYAGNPFLSKFQTASAAPTTASTNKYNPPILSGITNQLPSSDKPKTTTPSPVNPRLTNLLYGSNLLEEDAKGDAKPETATEITFKDRGLFDTAPHCQAGQILVNNICRTAV